MTIIGRNYKVTKAGKLIKKDSYGKSVSQRIAERSSKKKHVVSKAAAAMMQAKKK